MKRFFTLAVLLIGIITAATLSGEVKPEPQDVHTYMQELIQRHRNFDTTDLFLTSYTCKGCHGFDPAGIANVTLAGIDINLFDDWETSMMGLAGVDPLWRAKVRHESLVNPAHADELETLCTSCHAPMGHFNAIYRGAQHYTLSDLQNDSLGLSGVGCLGCHSIGTDGLGSRFTGDIPFDTSRVAFGPFEDPMTGPMLLYTNFLPAYSPHVSEGRFCSPCHTLITNTVDLEGNPTGDTYIEQATFHEWLNSGYPEMDITCQTCHMPEIEDPVKIAVGYINLPGRTPFNLHTFSGANSFMVNLIKQNKEALGVTASDRNFDSTLAEITRLLRNSTVDLSLADPIIDGDTVQFDVSITNKAGHKFPSGYPARRAFVEFVVLSAMGDTLFSSGVPEGASGNIKNFNGHGEPHHQFISRTDQVQIYEQIMGDVNGNITTMLERAKNSLKDNRIPPSGFSTQHSTYDTVLIVGAASSDPDFNRSGFVEGTGRDIVHYRIALSDLTQAIQISVKVHYQAVPPEWLTEMRNFQATEINQFLAMYDAADKKPELIAELTREDVLIPLGKKPESKKTLVQIFPNPIVFGNDVLIQSNVPVKRITVYAMNGALQEVNPRKISQFVYTFQARLAKGVYLIDIETFQGRELRRLVIR